MNKQLKSSPDPEATAKSILSKVAIYISAKITKDEIVLFGVRKVKL